MSPSNPGSPGPLSGLDALFSSLPVAATPRGGVDSGFTGVTTGPTADVQDEQGQFAGMGELLELPDDQLFTTVDSLVQRQELIAQNHLAQDAHWALVVGGYPFSTLKHDTTRDVWTQALPYGVSAVTIQAVPNKVLDQVNKKSEAVLVDFPEPDPEPLDDSEEAEGACEVATRFLAQDMGEQGTNDPALFDERLKRALWSSSTYVECWVDPAGGGYVPLQIEAHPQATDANNPLVGPDRMPTTDLVQRYVTIDPDGNTRFVNSASEAAPQWQPKLKGQRWNREHIRCYPEDKPVWEAERVIVLGYCTVSEGRRRWESVGQMSDSEIEKLCDWTPQRYLVLLPPFQRARWNLAQGNKQKANGKSSGGSSDERLFFYYHVYQHATPDYPKGADLVVSGASGGLAIDRDTLSADVTIAKNGTETKESRCLEIPIVQLRPRQDLLTADPSGRPYVEMIAGAAENNAFLANRFSRAIDKTLTNPFVTLADSPISGDTIADARSSGDMLTVISKDGMPQQLPAPVMPNAFFEMYDRSDEALNSIGTTERAAVGAENSKEKSGRAIQLATSNNNVGNTSILQAFNDCLARWNRIKLEQAMRTFSTPQLLRYEGEDGTAKADEFKAMDFALVGKVSIKAGTGTGLPPTQKVDYLGQLRAEGFIQDEEAQDAARPAFSKTLGTPPNPHEQYVARCVQSWLDGPPEAEAPDPNAPVDPTTGQPQTPPDWKAQYSAWMTAQQQYEAAQSTYQQQQQAFMQYQTNAAMVAGGPPPPTLGPEQQNERAMTDYQQAVLALRVADMTAAQSGVNPSVLPQPPQPPQVPKPWTPFEPRPNDTVPAIAAIWERRLSRVMSSNKYRAFGPEWTDVLNRAYSTARQALAIASGAGAPPPTAQPDAKGRQPAKPVQPQQATPQQPHGAAA